MPLLLAALLLPIGIDGQAALRHASALASLGPHPWGSPRAQAAAAYVQAQFQTAGLEEVRLQAFEREGLRGANVIGVLRASGPEFVVLGAHHDTAPEAPGAYDDGGGVGVLIEAARTLAARPSRARTIVFVSFDGEEAWSTGKTTTAGSRAYVASLGPRSRDLVAALLVEMCGWPGGQPVFHPIPYADPLRPGAPVVTPAWLMRAALEGARANGRPMPVGDPLLPWLYQPAVRLFRGRLYGDDLSFLQARLPAVFVSDSSFSSFYPAYHQPSDTRDKLDAPALERMGGGVLGALEALQRVRRGPESEPDWFAGFGHVLGGGTLLALGLLSLAPGLVVFTRGGGPGLVLRLLHAALFAVLLWRHPVPVLALGLLPNLLSAFGSRLLTLAAYLPALALAGLGARAYRLELASGLWLEPWELALLIAALALAWPRPALPGARGRRTPPAAGGRAGPVRRGLPRRR